VCFSNAQALSPQRQEYLIAQIAGLLWAKWHHPNGYYETPQTVAAELRARANSANPHHQLLIGHTPADQLVVTASFIELEMGGDQNNHQLSRYGKMWLTDIFTHPCFRGKGYASKLIEKACTVAQQMNFKGVYLCCEPKPLFKYYSNLKFKYYGFEDLARPQEAPEPVVVMYRRLD
jgi:GNAT superfamily N-acetyltransferase